jgi:cell division protease FtsH
MSQDQWQKPYSDETAEMIDNEVRLMIEKQYLRAQQVLRDHSDELNILAKELLSREVLLKSDVIKLIGPRPFPEPRPHLRPQDVSLPGKSDADSTPSDEEVPSVVDMGDS